MNKTKLATLTLIGLLTAGTALAQQAGPGFGPGAQGGPCPRGQGMGRGGWNDGGDRAANQLERMAWRLNLTPEQKAKLEPILRQRDEMRTAQRQAMRQEIAGILTPEQLAQFERMGPGRGGPMGPGRGPGMGPGMGQGGGRGWQAPAPSGQPQP